MTKKNELLEDGCYPCNATLHIKEGKAAVVLHNTFGLPIGSNIPLYRSKCSLLIEGIQNSELTFFNGHAII